MKTSTIITIQAALAAQLEETKRKQKAIEENKCKLSGMFFGDVLVPMASSLAKMTEEKLEAALEDFNKMDWAEAAPHGLCTDNCKETCK